MEINQKTAGAVLMSREILEERGVKHPIKIAYIATQDRDGNPLVQYAGTDSEETVSAIYVRAYTAHNMQRAVKAYKAGEFEEAMNGVPLLSIAVPTDKARQFEAGDNVIVVLGEYVNKEGDTVTKIDTITGLGMATKKLVNPMVAILKGATEEVVKNNA